MCEQCGVMTIAGKLCTMCKQHNEWIAEERLHDARIVSHDVRALERLMLSEGIALCDGAIVNLTEWVTL